MPWPWWWLFGFLDCSPWTLRTTLHLPGGLLRFAFNLVCMSGQLAEAVRTVIATLRSLANTLESALARAEVSATFTVDLESAHSWEPPVTSEPALAQFSTPGHGSVPALPFSSPARTNYSTNSYHEAADSIPLLPGYCLDWCIRMGGSKEEVASRATRAWTAGCWARAAFDGRVPKPRPTPQLLSQRSTVYIILKAPGLSAPVRVGTAAESFRLVPSFKEGGQDSNSISHSFPSLVEAKVYCAGFCIDRPQQQ